MSLDFSKPENLQTRDGKEVRIYATDHKGGCPIVGAVKLDGGWDIADWTSEGRYLHDFEASLDLIMKDNLPPQAESVSENVSKAPNPAPKIVQILASGRNNDALFALDSDGGVWNAYWSTSEWRWEWRKIGPTDFS